MKSLTKDGYRLLHEGVQALSIVEGNGIKVDVDYLKQTIVSISEKIKALEADYKEHDVFRQWKKRYGEKMKLSSREQLGNVLFKVMEYPVYAYTDTNRYSTDEAALNSVDDPFVNAYLEVERLKKARGTYLRGIAREVGPDGFLHPSFNLHTVVTYRSSSDRPNFQNIPIRNPQIAELVRRAFLPRAANRHLVEIDYGGVEVKVAACYTEDPQLLKYIKDPTTDMHRDMGMQCYCLSPKQMTSSARKAAKSKFVFPEFYGNIYTACAKDLWKGIDEFGLVMPDGTSMKKHLAKKGWKKLGACDPKHSPRPHTFEKHIQLVEKDFWGKRFKVYAQWKQDWWQAYKKKGWFDTLTGFRIHGLYKHNEVVNYPIQGSAFHCLLWSLIRLVKKELRNHGFKSIIVGQIHDSIVADVHHKELKPFLRLCQEVMVDQLTKAWPWIIVPMEVDFEVAPEGKSWFEKETYELN